MTEETEAPKKTKWWKKLLKMIIKSPVNTLFGLAVICFGAQAYMFDPTITNKIALFAIIGLWVFWFLAKQAFMLLITLGLLIGGASMYYTYTHQEAKKCEEAGGYWNSNTQVCEEKRSWWDKVKAYFNKTVQSKPEEVKKVVVPDDNNQQQPVSSADPGAEIDSAIDELTGNELAILDSVNLDKTQGEKE